MANKTRRRKMFISVLPGEQVEVVLAEDGVIQEYYVEMLHQAKTKGNIYKGYIHNIDPALQAAFVNIGFEKNGFLQIDEVHPEYYLQPHDSSKHKYPLIQKVLKAGQEVLVQVVKEPAGTKGAFVTSYLSLPGRSLVLTPGREQVGVSRKVEDEQERARLKEVLSGLTPGKGLGCIVRTAAVGQTKTSISKDLTFLKRLWKEVRKRGATQEAPSLVHAEPDLAERSVRDYLTEDVAEIWIDDAETTERVKEFAGLIYPRRAAMVKHHDDPAKSLWERFSLRKQLDEIFSREVTLPSGGRLVFDQTEALMAVDINSGKIGGKTNFHEMATKTNLEAAEAIARHLRLRDIGGQIVVDFIELKDKKTCRDVERTLKTAMKPDRARHDVGRISKFGLLEIVRQRMAQSAISVSTETCPVCGGSGVRRNMEWQAMQALREISRQLRKNGGQKLLDFKAPTELALFLMNRKRESLHQLEQDHGAEINISIEC